MAEAKAAASAVPKKPAIDHAHPLSRTLLAKLDYDQLTNCMRCGFCLPACPTFRETGVEPESPRGRIALMKAVADGLMEPDQAFRDQMDHCLGCRACEPVCPADVKYGQLIEQARDAIEDHAERGIAARGVRRLLFQGIFPSRRRLRLLGKALAFYQKSGLRRLVRSSGMMKLFPEHLREMESILPEATGRGVIERIGTFYPANKEKVARVALFRGCVMDVLFAETNVHTVKLLAEAGFEVVIPRDQVCCGALHAHSGELETARDLARRNLEAFKDAGIDYIVSNAGGCGALLAEYDHLLQQDPSYRELAASFSSRVIDVSRLLAERGRLLDFAETGAGSAAETTTVTYQDSCHLRNVMGSSDAPRHLMKRVAGVTFAEMREADRCCGSAGIYNVTQPEMAGQILEHKMEHANATKARYLLTSNPGCLLQMRLGVMKHGNGSGMEAMHIVDFLYGRLSGPPD
ncbi:4Fe-4S dicluster domain-containing protein [Cohnella sp. CFH 77786]|uniref:(Fe-S)-binding protein n=1 Tax=Cohnella sp. CFH 77786 TaxID=2662265 RepID=UPI001C60BF2F|nr:(Fe-S)-binding protein [Cohnella sp. CFH 77786]MBW5445130.1 4Fe-4S dicluster domain-containing protein [Cohnella sp. CFH 77786]